MCKFQTRDLFLLSRHPYICLQCWHLKKINAFVICFETWRRVDNILYFYCFLVKFHLLGLIGQTVSLGLDQILDQIPLVRSDWWWRGSPIIVIKISMRMFPPPIMFHHPPVHPGSGLDQAEIDSSVRVSTSTTPRSKLNIITLASISIPWHVKISPLYKVDWWIVFLEYLWDERRPLKLTCFRPSGPTSAGVTRRGECCCWMWSRSKTFSSPHP